MQPHLGIRFVLPSDLLLRWAPLTLQEMFMTGLEQLMKDKKVLQENAALAEHQRKKAAKEFTFGNE